MTTQCPADPIHHLSDDDLLRRVGELTGRSRHTEAALLAHLAEIDARRLYLREACSSLFAYCTERLHFSAGEAGLRIAAARAAHEHPVVLDMLADGRLHLTAVALLAPHLTASNGDAVLSRAVHHSKREVQELVAELSPRPAVPSLIRKLPTRGVAAPTAALLPSAEPVALAAMTAVLEPRPATADRSDSPVSPREAARPDDVLPEPRVGARTPAAAPRHTPAARLEPLAPGRYRVQFTASTELRDKLELLRTLMRPTLPDGDLARVIEDAVTARLAQLKKRKEASTQAPRTSLADSSTRPCSRYIAAAVRRAVHERDGGQCTYRDDQGRRCSARGWLQLHHRHPYGYGGDHSVGNVALLCRAHNRYLEQIDFGRGPTAGPADRAPRSPAGYQS